jgi:lysophospholipase L1-like esterase
MMVVIALTMLANNGDHPNAAGYDIAAGRWYDKLKPLLGG